MGIDQAERYQAFWSYTHKDNEADSGRITQLADDLAAEYGLLTSADMKLFLDISEIEWGAALLPSIGAALAQISFFIPVITPRYFKSDACRKELQDFHASADALGLSELILPVLYVDVPELQDTEPSDDQLVNVIKERKWFDWRDLRLADRSSSEYRSGINKMADRVRTASLSAQAANLAAGPREPDGGGTEAEDEDEFGPLDRMVLMEEAFPAITETLEKLQVEIVGVGELTQTWAERLPHAPTLRARLTAIKKYAGLLQPHSDRVASLGGQFSKQLSDIDFGMSVVVQQIGSEFEGASTEEKQQMCDFVAMIRNLVESSREGLGAIKELADSIEEVEGTSKDVRPPLRTLRRGLQMAVDGGATIEQWDSLIDAAGIDCDSTASGVSSANGESGDA